MSAHLNIIHRTVFPSELSGLPLPCSGLKSFPEPLRLRLPLRSPLVAARASGRPIEPRRAKREGSEGVAPDADAEALERDLRAAVAEEDYARAAEIRDSLRLLGEDARSLVLAANARFYEAFRAGDLAAMQGLWASGEGTCCVHPGAGGIRGRDDVVTSWEYVWANYEFPLDIQLKDVRAHARGHMGYVTCVELVRTKGSTWGGQFVTNVFERVGDCWFIAVHHASPIDL